MRTIKFRGKTTNGEWIYGDLVQQQDLIVDSISYCIFPLIAYDSYDNYIVDGKTVGQSTGLYDKDGNEIYEGDVVLVDFEFTDIVKKYTVEWSKHTASFVLTMFPGTGYGLFMDKEFVEKSVKVIGNMYQGGDEDKEYNSIH